MEIHKIIQESLTTVIFPIPGKLGVHEKSQIRCSQKESVRRIWHSNTNTEILLFNFEIIASREKDSSR